MTVNKWNTALLGVGALLLISCNGPEEIYYSPKADAGESQILTLGTTVTLDASASDVCCEKAIAYQWYFKQIPIESSIDDVVFGSSNGSPDGSTVQWVPDVTGTYVIGLIVSDDTTSSEEDVLVLEVEKNNDLPIGNAGPDQVGVVGDLIRFDGTLSSDEKGVQLTYEWFLAAAPPESSLTENAVFDADQPSAAIVPDVAGTFVLGLQVFDKTDWSTPDYVTAKVYSDNAPPVADAGSPGIVPPCVSDSISLNGFGSYDPESAPLTYDWTVMSVPEGSTATGDDLSDPNSPNPNFSPDVIPGEYGFRLAVNDGGQTSAYDEVTMTVTSMDDNLAPIAESGEKQTISQQTDCPVVSGNRKCEPCRSLEFIVDASASSDPNGDPLSFSWSADDGSFSATELPLSIFHSPEFEGKYSDTVTKEYTLTTSVSDCENTITDTLTITVKCEGVAP